ncbi:glycoside hydrolase family 16 protein [Mycena rebaudengoi]|nr:glycoside hydrolase family 16 protein [Mycena rebaudengoi]
MPSFTTLALLSLSLPFTTLAAVPRAGYKLQDHYTGEDFLTWDFWSYGDPTHGLVNYLTKEDAVRKGLMYVQKDGTTVMAVDDKPLKNGATHRDSVRISSPKQYDTGLFITDIFAMPHGPTIWPAYWTVGKNWPEDGEIDILEGVGDSTTNQITLHTSAGCSLDTSTASSFIGKHTATTDCTSGNGSNNGCGITKFGPAAYGHELNLQAGGVFAHIVDPDVGISVWQFPRTAIPEDITDKNPDPSKWGKPAAFFSKESCDITKHFRQQALTFDTTLCGDWAGNAFPGGMSACAAAVKNSANFDTSKWMLNYVSVYQL